MPIVPTGCIASGPGIEACTLFGSQCDEARGTLVAARCKRSELVEQKEGSHPKASWVELLETRLLEGVCCETG